MITTTRARARGKAGLPVPDAGSRGPRSCMAPAPADEDLVTRIIHTSATPISYPSPTGARSTVSRPTRVPVKAAWRGTAIVNFLAPGRPDERIQTCSSTPARFQRIAYLLFATRTHLVRSRRRRSARYDDPAWKKFILPSTCATGDEVRTVGVITTSGDDGARLHGLRGSGLNRRSSPDRRPRPIQAGLQPARAGMLAAPTPDEVVSVDPARDDDEHPDRDRRQATGSAPNSITSTARTGAALACGASS